MIELNKRRQSRIGTPLGIAVLSICGAMLLTPGRPASGDEPSTMPMGSIPPGSWDLPPMPLGIRVDLSISQGKLVPWDDDQGTARRRALAKYARPADTKSDIAGTATPGRDPATDDERLELIKIEAGRDFVLHDGPRSLSFPALTTGPIADLLADKFAARLTDPKATAADHATAIHEFFDAVSAGNQYSVKVDPAPDSALEIRAVIAKGVISPWEPDHQRAILAWRERRLVIDKGKPTNLAQVDVDAQTDWESETAGRIYVFQDGDQYWRVTDDRMAETEKLWEDKYSGRTTNEGGLATPKVWHDFLTDLSVRLRLTPGTGPGGTIEYRVMDLLTPLPTPPTDKSIDPGAADRLWKQKYEPREMKQGGKVINQDRLQSQFKEELARLAASKSVLIEGRRAVFVPDARAAEINRLFYDQYAKGLFALGPDADEIGDDPVRTAMANRFLDDVENALRSPPPAPGLAPPGRPASSAGRAGRHD